MSSTQSVELLCISVSPEGHVATFEIAGELASEICGISTEAGSEVFAYLPHVPGLNPFLLNEGDSIAGVVVPKNGRLELVAATRQLDRRAPMPSGVEN